MEDENSLTYFDDSAFWTAPNAVQIENMDITRTCFTALVKAMFVKIAKTLRRAQLESSSDCFLGPTATLDSLLNWNDIMQIPVRMTLGAALLAKVVEVEMGVLDQTLDPEPLSRARSKI